jgi:hypothetical protein
MPISFMSLQGVCSRKFHIIDTTTTTTDTTNTAWWTPNIQIEGFS